MTETPEHPADDHSPAQPHNDTPSTEHTTPEHTSTEAAAPQTPAPAATTPQPDPTPAHPAPAAATTPLGVAHPAPGSAHPAPGSAIPAPAPTAAHAAPTAAPTTDHAQTAPLHPGVRPPEAETSSAPKSDKKRAPVSVIAALAIGALVGGVSGAGVSYLALSNNGASTTNDAATLPANVTINDPDNATTVTAVAASAGASVVTISASGSNAAGTGSGIIISDEGYILTNAHVVTLSGATGDATVRVQMSDGRLFPAEIIGTDPQSDLAVIKVDGVTGLKAIEFADSSELNVGDTAIAIGAPLGLNNTVTNGIISALNRSITIASSAVPEETVEEAPEDENNPFDMWQFDIPGQEQAPAQSSSTISLAVIQTDAAINPGNSGGALLNAAGELIGVNVAIASAGESAAGNIGVGFAVPANLAKRVSDEIIADGKATHGLLGAEVLDVSEDESQADSATVGASVMRTTPDGAAAKAGLRAGDLITGLNGLPITSKTDLTAQVRSLAAGSEAEITYVRDGKTATTTVTLGTLE